MCENATTAMLPSVGLSASFVMEEDGEGGEKEERRYEKQCCHMASYGTKLV